MCGNSSGLWRMAKETGQLGMGAVDKASGCHGFGVFDKAVSDGFCRPKRSRSKQQPMNRPAENTRPCRRLQSCGTRQRTTQLTTAPLAGAVNSGLPLNSAVFAGVFARSRRFDRLECRGDTRWEIVPHRLKKEGVPVGSTGKFGPAKMEKLRVSLFSGDFSVAMMRNATGWRYVFEGGYSFVRRMHFQLLRCIMRESESAANNVHDPTISDFAWWTGILLSGP